MSFLNPKTDFGEKKPALSRMKNPIWPIIGVCNENQAK